MAGATKRSFGLSAEEVAELSEEFKKTKKFPSPYRSGAYAHTIRALVTLGTNRFHPLGKVHEAFRKAASDDWYAAWASKEKRVAEGGKDAEGRFVQNLRVLQRTKDYGRKLLQVGQKVLKKKGAVIDLRRAKDGGLLVALNTNSAKPQKPGRATAKKAAQKGPRKPQKAQGTRKGKSAARRAPAKQEQPQERPETPNE